MREHDRKRCRELSKKTGNINITAPQGLSPLRTTKERSICTNYFPLFDVEGYRDEEKGQVAK